MVMSDPSRRPSSNPITWRSPGSSLRMRAILPAWSLFETKMTTAPESRRM